MVVRKINGIEPVAGVLTLPVSSTVEPSLVILQDSIDENNDKAITPNAVNVHAEKVASVDEFGHVKVDGNTIRISSSGKLQVDASVRNITWVELDSFDMTIVGNFIYSKVDGDGCDIPMPSTQSFTVEILPIYYNDNNGYRAEERIVTVLDLNSNNTIQYSRKYSNVIEHPTIPSGQERSVWSVIGYRPDGLTITSDENGVMSAVPVRGERGEQGVAGKDGVDGQKGDNGEGFSITKTYPNIQNMIAEHSTDGVAVGKFVIIANPNNDTDDDNGKVYVKTINEYVFVVNMSGSTGLRGEKGEDGKDGLSAIVIPNENRMARIWVGTTKIVGNEGLWTIDYTEANFSEVINIQSTIVSSVSAAAEKPSGGYITSMNTTSATGKCYTVTGVGLLAAMQLTALNASAGTTIHVMVVGH